MPGVDWIPGVAQLKTVCQLVTGDFKGAATTHVNFCQECPGMSQLFSLALLATGDKEAALETQKKCLGTINNVANGIPVVGHVKGKLAVVEQYSHKQKNIRQITKINFLIYQRCNSSFSW